ncbi:MAG: AAA family ATPase [Pseudonocardia sp.]|nr:AAA family ATPase [Pseudonocardia sp.]
MDLLERDAELTNLEAALTDAGSGEGSVVLVHGEAGIGKTSLLRAFRRGTAGRVRLLAGACDDLVTPRTFGPLRDAAAPRRHPRRGAGRCRSRRRLRRGPRPAHRAGRPRRPGDWRTSPARRGPGREAGCCGGRAPTGRRPLRARAAHRFDRGRACRAAGAPGVDPFPRQRSARRRRGGGGGRAAARRARRPGTAGQGAVDAGAATVVDPAHRRRAGRRGPGRRHPARRRRHPGAGLRAVLPGRRTGQPRPGGRGPRVCRREPDAGRRAAAAPGPDLPGPRPVAARRPGRSRRHRRRCRAGRADRPARRRPARSRQPRRAAVALRPPRRAARGDHPDPGVRRRHRARDAPARRVVRRAAQGAARAVGRGRRGAALGARRGRRWDGRPPCAADAGPARGAHRQPGGARTAGDGLVERGRGACPARAGRGRVGGRRTGLAHRRRGSRRPRPRAVAPHRGTGAGA